MDFSYPETHLDLKNLASSVLQDFSGPDRLKQLESRGAYMDHALWEKLLDTGLATASLDESLGGMSMDYSAATLVAEQIGQTVVSTPFIPSVMAVLLPLQETCTEGNLDATVAEALRGAATGESLIVAALIEPGNEERARPRAEVVQADGQYRISGIKHCVPYAADATGILVNAVCGGELFLGLLSPHQPGAVTITEQHCTGNEPQYQLALEGAEITCVARGEAARDIIIRSAAMTTVAYCAMGVGVADRMTRIGAEYTSQREQFGVPIATFQAVAHRLADCYIDTERLRMLTLKAASDIDAGIYDSDVIYMAKACCGDVLYRVSQASQHVHGGIGIDRDYHLFRYCLWAKQIELTLGCSKAHVAVLADRLESRCLLAAVGSDGATPH